MTIAPDSLPDDIAALKRMIADMARDAVAAQTEIAKLKFQLARYRRAEFGRSSEKLAREVEQLELAIETLEADQAERQAAASPAVAAAIEEAVDRQKPARRPLPEHLPREEVRHPAACTCPHCGGALRRIGEEVTETLDYVPGRFKVIRHVREKLSCRACDTVVAAPAPDHVIARGRAGAGLLAHIAISKYDDHLPLFARPRSSPAKAWSWKPRPCPGGWGDGGSPQPAGRRARGRGHGQRHIACRRHAGAGAGAGHRRAKTRRMWTYVRDERPFAGKRPPTALFFYSADRKGAHPQRHLKDFRGVIHADGYAGFNELFAGNRIAEAACWAHVRRKFFDVHAATGSPIAKEALDRIGDLYKVERRSPACRPSGGYRNARSARNRSPRRWPPGPQKPCPSCPASPNWPKPSATCARAARGCCAASPTAAWRSTTMPPSGRCAASRSAARLPVRRLRRRRQPRRGALFPDRNPQAQRCQPAALSRRPSRSHRRSPGPADAELLPWNWKPLDLTRFAA